MQTLEWPLQQLHVMYKRLTLFCTMHGLILLALLQAAGKQKAFVTTEAVCAQPQPSAGRGQVRQQGLLRLWAAANSEVCKWKWADPC